LEQTKEGDALADLRLTGRKGVSLSQPHPKTKKKKIKRMEKNQKKKKKNQKKKKKKKNQQERERKPKPTKEKHPNHTPKEKSNPVVLVGAQGEERGRKVLQEKEVILIISCKVRWPEGESLVFEERRVSAQIGGKKTI